MNRRWTPSSRRDRRWGSRSGRRAARGTDRYFALIIGGFALVVILIFVAILVYGS
ncbi:MAG TPA: hypothetical protein VFJ72_03430 [Rubrobacteraceae bacterium]|nr:hypothetical protein [Rubrobacteraceae bacterium]